MYFRKSSTINIEKKREYNNKWNSENRDKYRVNARKSISKKRQTLMGHLSSNISCGIWKSLKDGKANRHWETLVGYSVEQLKKHLEKQFSTNMSWENYGTWHVDHKIPIMAFNFKTCKDIDFNKCWALNNLQPMWAKENLSKHCKLIKPFQPSLNI